MSAAEAWDGTGPDPANVEPPPEPEDLLEQWDHPPSAPGRARRTIRIAVGRQSLSRMILELIDALGEADQNLYQRDGELVRIVREPDRVIPAHERAPGDPHAHLDRRRGASIVLRPGTPRIVSAAPVLLERADIAVNWESFKKTPGRKKEGADPNAGEWIPADPNATVVRQVATRREWPSIRPIRGLIEAPCLAPSGRLIQAPGYDEETGHVLIPSLDVGPIIDSPTQEHSRAALRYLWDRTACDFPFRGVGEPDHERDPERALQYAKALEVPDAFVGSAVLMGLFARLAIDGAMPAGIFEAAGQGSGKSLQMHTIALIATGRPAGVATFPTRDGRVDDAELEKIIMGYALLAARLICFDNVRGTLSGGSVERALTSVDTIDGRVLGSNDQRSIAWYATLLFSGNNMTCSDDVAQRSLLSRLESSREDPRARPRATFRYPDLLAEIRRERARLVRAVLVILRAYLAARDAGKDVPDPGTRGSFEAWSKIIPGALMYAGGPNILRAFPEAGRGGDEEGEAHGTLMRLWRDAWQGQRAATILEHVFRERDPHGPPDPQLEDVASALRALTKTREGKEVGSHAFGTKLRALRGKVRDGLKIEVGSDPSAKVATYSVVRAT